MTFTSKVLFVFVILAHERRRIVHFNVTEHPSAQWTAQQMVEAFARDEVPRYLLRGRDATYGEHFQRRIDNMGIEEVLIASRSPWQNPYVERVIGSIRRDLLDHVSVLNEQHLRRLLSEYMTYYHRFRTHLSLAMDCPEPRLVEPPEAGKVAAVPEVEGLQHHKVIQRFTTGATGHDEGNAIGRRSLPSCTRAPSCRTRHGSVAIVAQAHGVVLHTSRRRVASRIEAAACKNQRL